MSIAVALATMATMRSSHLARLALTLAAVVACDADLETSCRDGSCTDPTTSATTGAGGSGGGGAFVCTHTDTAGFPCEVYDVLVRKCQGCHKPMGQGPFPLLTYDDTQQWLYNITPDEDPVNAKRIWARMETQIQPGASAPAMPLNLNPMEQELIDRMNAWFATCGEDVQVANQCARGEGAGGSGGAGSAGGAGGTGGSGGAGGG